MVLFQFLAVMASVCCVIAKETILADVHVEKINIAIVSDGPSEYDEEVSRIFRKEILALVGSEYEVVFPEDKQIRGDWTISSVRNALDDVLYNDEVDLIIALGILASSEISRRGPLKTPVIAPYVLNPKLQGIPLKDGKSNTANLSYLTVGSDIGRQIELFGEIVSFKKLLILGSSTAFDANPEFFKNLFDVARAGGTQVDFVSVTRTADSVITAITDTTEAVYVLPLMGLPEKEFDRIVRALIQYKLPSFSLLGETEVKKGVLLGLAQESNVEHLARLVGVNVRRILEGEMPSTFPVNFSIGERLSLNMNTARLIDFSPAWELLSEGLLIDPELNSATRRVSLSGIAQELRDTGLDVRIQSLSADKDRQNIFIALSRLLPKIDYSAQHVTIQTDDVVPHQNSERSVSGKIKLSQVLFSEPILTSIGVQKDLNNAIKSQVDQVVLDAVQEGLNSYLNLLRAKRVERTRQENLLLMRSHLEMATIRRRVGVAESGEIHRWNGEIANARSALTGAISNRHSAQLDLNRILSRPLEENFSTEEIGLEDPIFENHLNDFLSATATPERLKLFCDFVISKYISTLPALRRIDLIIDAQKKSVRSSFHSFWAPTIALQGSRTENYYRNGAGSKAEPVGGDVNWAVGINASVPLFNGGERIAKVRQTKVALKELKLQRESTTRLLHQRTRTAVYRANNSGLGIGFAFESANASRKNLAIVRDAYARGVVSILSLLDAHNNVVNADEIAGDAIYRFFLDIIEVERSIGTFLVGDAARIETFFKEVENYVSKHEK